MGLPSQSCMSQAVQKRPDWQDCPAHSQAHSQTVHPTCSQAVCPAHSQTVHPTCSQAVCPAHSQTVHPTCSQAVCPAHSQTVHPTCSQAVCPAHSQTVHPTCSQAVCLTGWLSDGLSISLSDGEDGPLFSLCERIIHEKRLFRHMFIPG